MGLQIIVNDPTALTPVERAAVIDLLVATGGRVEPAVPPLPALIPPAPAVPFTAAAESLPTAPVEPPAGTPAPTAAFAQPAATPVPPAATVAPPSAPPVPGVSLDTGGLPWDGRIHSETRSKNADGSWRRKRGVEPEIVTAVEAELRAAMGAPAVPPPAAVPPPPPGPIDPLANLGRDMRDAARAPLPPPVTPPLAALTFPALMTRITQAIEEKRLTQGQVLEAVKGAGLPTLPTLAARPDLVQAVADALLL